MQTSAIGPVLVALLGCGRGAPPSEATSAVDPATAARGKALIGELKKSLLGRLGPALADGPAHAIGVCSTDAPAIAAALGTDGATVGRATRKPRNPENLATGWRADALAQFEAVRDPRALAGAAFTRRLPDGKVAYAEPLVIQELCTACHGTALAADVRAALAERYPADQATGYAVGDLRGIAWAELPAPK